jgi:spore coat protein U-like protein
MNFNFFNRCSIKKVALNSSALTCLLAVFFLYNQNVKAQVTTSSNLDVSADIGSSCSIFSADTMNFGAYVGSELTAESAITIDCSSTTVYTITLTDSHQGSSPYYKLVRTGGSESTSSDYLQVALRVYGSNTFLQQTVSTIVGTASGNPSVAHTLQGVLTASQTGKTAGSYRKLVSLNLSY